MLRRMIRKLKGKEPAPAAPAPAAPASVPEDFVTYEGLVLPRKRSNLGLRDEATYVASAVEQIEPLSDRLKPNSRILDFGCGQGRFLIGLRHLQMPFGAYLGIDIDKDSVGWCIRRLSDTDQNVAFAWYNGNNARYNDGGIEVSDVPVPNGFADLIFANSVFSHLEPHDVESFPRILRPKMATGGTFYLTAYVEENVEQVAYDPEGYYDPGNKKLRPLQIVRYERSFFIDSFKRAGFELEDLRQNGITRTGQTELIFRATES